MSALTPSEIEILAVKLSKRREQLSAMIRAGTADAAHDSERLGPQVGDPGDESAALQQADLNLTEVETELRELKAIDRAFERIKEGAYGYCIDCDCAIPYARLDAYPTAERCTECQTRHERMYGGRDTTPSL